MAAMLRESLANDPWTPYLELLLDTGAKGLVLLALAGFAAFAMRRATAAARHLVWLLALAGLLLLPLISLVAPRWQLSILPALPAPQVSAIPAAAPPREAAAPESTGPIRTASETTPSMAPASPAVQPESHPPLPGYVLEDKPATPPAPVPLTPAALLAWGSVVLVTLLPLLLGHITIARMRSHMRTFPDGTLTQLAQSLMRTLRLPQSIPVHAARDSAMPMAAGLLRPAVFLPREAEAWPEEKQRAVLLHELAHIKRRDCLTHTVACMAVALHWFNPLAWYALRQLRIEREHACDDLVLAAGERPSDYARHLLEIARSLRAGTLVSAAGITMAKRNHLEGRLLAILDAARNRGLLTWKFIVAAVLAATAAAAILGGATLGREISSTGDLLDRARPVKETTLESLFGGWRNLPFQLSAAEETDAKQCVALAQAHRHIENGVNQFTVPAVREQLEQLLTRRPDYFYAEYLLGMWYQLNGDPYQADHHFQRSYRHAPVVLVQRYEDSEQRPVSGARVQSIELECNRVQDGVLDPSLLLLYFDLVTDAAGAIYLPAYDTVFRTNAISYPDDLEVNYPALGWFKSRGNVGLLPTARAGIVGSDYEQAVASDESGAVQVGGRSFHMDNVWRMNAQQALNPPDPGGVYCDGAHKRRYPELAEGEWDCLLVDIGGEGRFPKFFDVVEIRVFDHESRKLLWDSDWGNSNDGSTDKIIGGFSNALMNTIFLARRGGEWPESIDLWLRIDLLEESSKSHHWLPVDGDYAIMSGSGRVGIEEIRAGSWSCTYSEGGGTVQWNDLNPGTENEKCSIVLRRSGDWDGGRMNVRAIDKQGNTHWPQSLHFLDFKRTALQVIHFPLPPDQLHELRFGVLENELDFRKTFYFDGIDVSTAGPMQAPETTPETAAANQPPARLQIRLVAPEGQHDDASAVPWHDAAAESPDAPELWLMDGSFIGQDDIESVEVRRGHVDTDYALALTLKADAAKGLAKVTGENVGRKLAIVVDGKVLSTPTIAAPIGDGPVMITGSFDRAAAEALAAQIRGDDSATELSAANAGLGPPVTLTVQHAGENCLVDFDTGTLHTPPDFDGTEDSLAWIRAHGIDAGGGLQEEIRGLIGMDIIVNPESNATWDAVETNGALDHDVLTLGTPGNPIYLSAKGDLPATYTFKTREGGVGIVQILGFTDEEPRGVNIRYRMRLAAPESTRAVDYDYLNSLEESDLLSAPIVSTRSKKEIPIASYDAALATTPTASPSRLPESLTQFFEASQRRRDALLEAGIKINFIQRTHASGYGVPDSAVENEYTVTLWMRGGDEAAEIRDAKGRTARYYRIGGELTMVHPKWPNWGSHILLPPNSDDAPPGTQRVIGHPDNLSMPGDLLAAQWTVPTAHDTEYFREAHQNGYLTESTDPECRSCITTSVRDGVDIIAVDAGGHRIAISPSLGFALVQDWDHVPSDFVELSDGVWFPRKVVDEDTVSSDLQGGWTTHGAEITVTNITLSPAFPEGIFSPPQPENGDLVIVDYPRWRREWEEDKQVSVQSLQRATDSEFSFVFGPDMTQEEKEIYLVSQLRHRTSDSWSSPKHEGTGLDTGAPAPFYDREKKEIVWATYDEAAERLRVVQRGAAKFSQHPYSSRENSQSNAPPIDIENFLASLVPGKAPASETKSRPHQILRKDTSDWGEAANGLQAAFRLKSDTGNYTLGNAIDLEFLVRNAGDSPIEFLTSSWRNGDPCDVFDAAGNEVKGGGVSLYSGLNEVRRIRLLPGEVDKISSASFAFLPKTSNTVPGHPVGAWIGAAPGTYSVRFQVHIPDSYMSSGEGAQREGDWAGDLTTGALSVSVVEPENENETAADGRVWGEAVDGLQASLKLSPSGGAFTLGEPNQADIQLRNVSDKDIEFTALNTALPGEIIVRDSAGHRVATGSNQILDISSGLHRYVIKPGEMAAIGHADITFVAEEKPAPSAWNRIGITPGAYTVQVTASITPFAELGLEGGKFEARPGDWTGQLTTGALSVLVVPHAETRATPTEIPAPDPTDDTTANVHWGEAHQGLQAGIRIEAKADAHPLNEPIEISLLIRNTGDTPVEFVSRKDYLCGLPKVLDEKGNIVLEHKIHLLHHGWQTPARMHLAPDETLTFNTHPLLFVPSEHDAEAIVSEIPVVAGPGSYTVQYELHLPAFQILVGPVLNHPDDWSGVLTTGIRELRITEQGPTRADAGPAAG